MDWINVSEIQRFFLLDLYQNHKNFSAYSQFVVLKLYFCKQFALFSVSKIHSSQKIVRHIYVAKLSFIVFSFYTKNMQNNALYTSPRLFRPSMWLWRRRSHEFSSSIIWMMGTGHIMKDWSMYKSLWLTDQQGERWLVSEPNVQQNQAVSLAYALNFRQWDCWLV